MIRYEYTVVQAGIFWSALTVVKPTEDLVFKSYFEALIEAARRNLQRVIQNGTADNELPFYNEEKAGPRTFRLYYESVIVINKDIMRATDTFRCSVPGVACDS